MQFRDICDQTRKLSYNVLNFARFLPSQILRGRCPLKVVPALSPHLAARYVAKFHEATPFGSKVLAANTLHFKPIFDPPFEKSCKGGPRPRWGVR